MASKFTTFGKGIIKIVDDKIQACKEILASAQNRLILGLVLLGLGGGLIASAFIRVSA